MRSNYKKLGRYIRQVDERNSDNVLGEDNLYGLSVSKEFISTHANLVGVSFDSYKVVAPKQFAYIPDTSRRGDKIAISLNSFGNKIIVSSICSVFEIIDENELLPEYLMLWFMRPEFDRYARFMSNGSAREVFDWDAMCSVELPVPPISEQRKIVHDYQVITDRIKLLQKINKCIYDIINIIFNSWITNHSLVSDVNYNETTYGSIPEKWKYKKLGDLCSTVTKGTTPTTYDMEFSQQGINFIKGESINDDHSFNKSLFAFIDNETDALLKRSRIEAKDILFTIAGTLGKFAIVDESVLPANTNQAVAILRVNEKVFSPEVLYSYFVGGWQTEFCKRNIQQAVQANLSLGTIKELPILVPDDKYLGKYSDNIVPLLTSIWKNQKEVEKLTYLQSIIVNVLHIMS